VLISALAAPLNAQNADSLPRRDSTGRCRVQPLPSIGSAPETGLQYGASVLTVCDPPASRSARPSTLVFYALRSSKNQTRIGVEAERWTTGNARRIAGSFVWKEFPLPYFGIGDRAPESARELFTPRGIEASVQLQQRVARALYVTGVVRHVRRTITTDTGGALRRDAVLGTRKGAITELSLALEHDTRENLFAPRGGHWFQLSYARSIDGLASSYAYGRVRADARLYRAVRGEHVLAAHAQVVGFDGSVPFDQRALAGGSDILRGYERGRYRDQWLAAAQGEYRTPIRRRLGGVVFAGGGIVAPSASATSGRVFLPSYGVGLRAQLDARQRTGIRADYGRGRDGASGIYLGFNQAF
jgi:hypothetical protein